MFRRLAVDILSTVQLTRLTHAFAAVANLWFVILWSRSIEEEHPLPGGFAQAKLWVLLGIAAVLGIGLSTYGGAVNDVFDARRDQAFSPNRPIPSGRMTPQTASLIGFVSLITSILAASILGSTILLVALFLAAAILFYNTMARHVPSLGLITIGVIYAAEMVMLNFGIRFIWPIILVAVHAMIVQGAVYRLEKKRPRHTVLTIIGCGIGLAGIIVALLWQAGRSKDYSTGWMWSPPYEWYGLAWPLLAVVVFAVNSVKKTRFASSPAFAAEKLQRYGSLWIGIYGITWLLGAGLYEESIILAVLVVLAILWMIVVRDFGAWIEQPIEYRWT